MTNSPRISEGRHRRPSARHRAPLAPDLRARITRTARTAAALAVLSPVLLAGTDRAAPVQSPAPRVIAPPRAEQIIARAGAEPREPRLPITPKASSRPEQPVAEARTAARTKPARSPRCARRE